MDCSTQYSAFLQAVEMKETLASGLSYGNSHLFQLKTVHKMGQMKTNKTKNKHTRLLLFKIKESNIYDKSCLSEIHLKQELFLLRKSQKSPKKINTCSLSISFFHFSL